MTTIATDGRSMAADGQESVSGTISHMASVKVYRLTDGRLFGACGSAHEAEQVRGWLNGEQEKPDVSKDFGAILLTSEGVEACSSALLFRETFQLMAMGSGMDFAIGAMEHGASPAEAVAIAVIRDPHTGGKITTLKLETTS